MDCIVYNVWFSLFSVLCKVYSLLCTVYSVLCTVYSVLNNDLCSSDRVHLNLCHHSRAITVMSLLLLSFLDSKVHYTTLLFTTLHNTTFLIDCTKLFYTTLHYTTLDVFLLYYTTHLVRTIHLKLLKFKNSELEIVVHTLEPPQPQVF